MLNNLKHGKMGRFISFCFSTNKKSRYENFPAAFFAVFKFITNFAGKETI